MPVLNYTTKVPVERTINEITRILTKRGVRSVHLDYDDQRPIALAFTVKTPAGERDFRLPCNIEAIHRLLAADATAGKIPQRQATKEHAFAVGWRIIKDWLEAQMSLIDVELVSLEEVMLPYLLNDRGETLYLLMTKRLFLLGSGDQEGGR